MCLVVLMLGHQYSRQNTKLGVRDVDVQKRILGCSKLEALMNLARDFIDVRIVSAVIIGVKLNNLVNIGFWKCINVLNKL